MISSARRSKRQPAPVERSRFDTVPDPMIVPAGSGRVRAACSIRRGKLNFMSLPPFGLPSSSPLTHAWQSRCSLRPSQASPSSSGVTTTGDIDEGGFAWKKPKPLASSGPIRVRRLTSFISAISRMCWLALSRSTAIGTSPVITAISISRSMPWSSLTATTSSQGPRIGSEQPWYISGSFFHQSGSSCLRDLRISSAWIRKLEASANWWARGSGAISCAVSRSKSRVDWRALASLQSCSSWGAQ